jgi:hypothetical protein
MALGSTQPPTGMSTRGKGRTARKADNLAAIYEPIVYKMWEPHHLTTLWASAACYRDTFTFFFIRAVLMMEPLAPNQTGRLASATSTHRVRLL